MLPRACACRFCSVTRFCSSSETRLKSIMPALYWANAITTAFCAAMTLSIKSLACSCDLMNVISPFSVSC